MSVLIIVGSGAGAVAYVGLIILWQRVRELERQISGGAK